MSILFNFEQIKVKYTVFPPKIYNLCFPPKFAFVLTSAMVFMAYVCADGLFLLPAFAPLAYGAMSGTGLWNCSRGMFVALLGLSSLAGVTVVKIGGGPLALNMLVVYIVVAGFLSMAGARLYPAFAVALLPVFISETRLAYVLVVLALSIVLVSMSWNGFSQRQKLAVATANQKQMVLFLVQAVFVFPLVFMSFFFANTSFLLPTLWYAFVEMCNGENHIHTLSRITQMLFAVLLGAVADVFASNLIVAVAESGGNVLTAIIYAVFILTSLLLFYTVCGRRIFLPALALIVFPFLRDGETSYVLATDFAILYLSFSAVLYRRLQYRLP